MHPEIGATATAEPIVSEVDLATVVGQSPVDGFPPMFATARMIALMELAASRVLHAHLTEGQVSVGVTVDVAHTAATPVGAKVTAHARFDGMDGKFCVFQIVARVAGDEIGRGTHKRAIVSPERLVSGALRRCAVVKE